jgi:hypothetical protein
MEEKTDEKTEEGSMREARKRGETWVGWSEDYMKL